jgi:hypothetical protein
MMKTLSDRRAFIQNLSKGVLSALFAIGLFRTAKSSSWVLFEDPADERLPRINPAFKMNVFADGKVELYTHRAEGDKVSSSFEGLEADILLKLSKRSDPKQYDPETGSKYNLEREAYLSAVNLALASLEDRGFIYQGETMLVKIVEAANE